MKWLDETRSTRFELFRHFLSTMFDSEMFSVRGQWRAVAINAFALALPAGMVLVDSRSAAKYRHLSQLPGPGPFRSSVFADQIALFSLLFAVTGLFGLLQWQSLFPSRRDFMALASLPIRHSEIFGARFASVLAFSVSLVAILNLVPAFAVPLQFSGQWQQTPYLNNVLAQGVPASIGCLSIMFAIIALQGALLNLLPGRYFTRGSVFVQFLLVAVLFLAGLSSWIVSSWQDDIFPLAAQFGRWAPPVWFAGLYEWMAGNRDSFSTAMATRALIAFLCASALMMLLYSLSFRRYRWLLLENPVQHSVFQSERWSALKLLSREPRKEAVIQFIGKTLSRSRRHRFILLCYVGAATAVVVNSSLLSAAAIKWSGNWRQTLGFASLFWPLATSAILLAGIRHVFRVPAELPANWIFQLTESEGRSAWMGAISRFVTAGVILPIHLCFLVPAILSLGWALALKMTVLQVLVSLCSFELLFQNWQQLPFTCSYVPGKKSLMAILSGWFAILGFVVPVLSIFIATVCQFSELFLVGVLVIGGVWIWARRYRRDGWEMDRLFYREQTEPLLSLGLNEIGAGVFPPDREAFPSHSH